jgi:serine/threonine protein kinase/streptogramin lyase
LERLLGQGGFAEVYLGEQVHLGTQAAVKLLHAPLANAPEIEQFRQEARTIAALVHPHIIRVLDFGVEAGLPYLILDYAPGGSLRQRHPPGEQVPLTTVVAYVQQLAQALQYAHDQKVIHRDLKPQNLLIGRTGELLLADFGISIVAESTSRQQAQGFAGTVAYCAPEQLQEHPRPASDQYALGVMVYEWLSGRLPFSGSFAEVAAKHLFAAPPSLCTQLPTLPPAVEQVVLTALAKDPTARFASVRAFANAFYLSSESQIATAGPPTGLSTDAPSTERFIPAPTLATPQTPSAERFTPAPTIPQAVPPVVPASQISTPPLSTPVTSASYQTTPPLVSSMPALPMTERALHPTQVASAPPVSAAGERTQVDSWRPPATPGAVPLRSGSSEAPRAPSTKRRMLILLAAVLVLVLVGSGIGLGLACKGPLTSLGNCSSSVGVITEFSVPGEPEEITAGPDGNLWFTENFPSQTSTSINKIGRLTPTGTLTEFSVPTPSDNTSLGLSGITAGPDGNLWFAENNQNLIGRITSAGNITEFPIPTANSYPLVVTGGPDGNVWFAEDSGGNIGRITPTGTITEFPYRTKQGELLGITTGPDGNLWFTDTGKVERITMTGATTDFPVSTAISYPWEITAGSDGNLWVTVNLSKTEGEIARSTTSGVITTFHLPTPGRGLRGITAGPDKNVWFTEFRCDGDPCNTSHSWIGRITTGGAVTEFPLTTPNNWAYGITAGPDGNIWFTDLDGKIGRITTGYRAAQGQTSLLLAEGRASLEAIVKRLCL